MIRGQAGAEPIDGSRLCLACGLCCQDLLHEWARLEEGEVEAARMLGLHTDVHAGGPAFALPCPCHRDGRCTIYEQRLSPCREYRCKLLGGYVDGKVTWEEGIRRVEQARQLVESIRGHLGAPGTGGSIWQQIRVADSRKVDAEAQVEIAALLALCQRHFRVQDQSARSFGP